MRQGVCSNGAIFELVLLHASVADKGSQHQRIGGNGSEENLHRCVDGPDGLPSLKFHDARDAVDGNDDGGETEREQQDKLGLAFQAHAAADNDRNGK